MVEKRRGKTEINLVTEISGPYINSKELTAV
jgi:hypothetical protein